MFCAACKKHASPTAGTGLRKSRVPLRSWFLAMWLACTQKTGLSAAGLQRTPGLGSYRTAWLLLQKLRSAMVRLGRERLEGTVGIDEADIGGAESGVRGRQLAGKCLVVVAVELHGGAMGRIRLRHVADASGGSLGELLRHCVEPGSDCTRTGGKDTAACSETATGTGSLSRGATLRAHRQNSPMSIVESRRGALTLARKQ